MSVEIFTHISQLDTFLNLAGARASKSFVFGIPPVTKGNAFGQSAFLEVFGQRRAELFCPDVVA